MASFQSTRAKRKNLVVTKSPINHEVIFRIEDLDARESSGISISQEDLVHLILSLDEKLIRKPSYWRM